MLLNEGCVTLQRDINNTIYDTRVARSISQGNPMSRKIDISVFQIEENASNIISLFRLYFHVTHMKRRQKKTLKVLRAITPKPEANFIFCAALETNSLSKYLH